MRVSRTIRRLLTMGALAATALAAVPAQAQNLGWSITVGPQGVVGASVGVVPPVYPVTVYPAPMYPAPVYPAPVYGAAYPAPVYPAPRYLPPPPPRYYGPPPVIIVRPPHHHHHHGHGWGHGPRGYYGWR